jgi:ATP-dependent DNA helicase RecQ
LPDFGIGKDRDKVFWKSIVRLALVNGYLFKNIEKYGLLSITEVGLAYIDKPKHHEMAVDTEFENVTEEDFENFKLESICDEVLFNHLKDIRRKVAKEKNQPPYVVFQDPSLEDMATKFPITLEELCNINGVSRNKAMKFGQPFVDYIAAYVKENDIDRPQDIVLKASAEKSGKRAAIIQNIDKKNDLLDIARSLAMEFHELVAELDNIVSSGTRLDIRYFINQFLDEDLQEEIVQYFRTTEEDNLEKAMQYFDGEYTLEELQLMRIQFLSDAN